MGIFNKLFTSKKTPITTEQNFKHNIYDAEISQYSSLPRYYYIQGNRYDIDSPESVSSIPLCKTDFNINEEHWGIDAILREHVNRYYSHIPEKLKSACYPKISDFEWSNYKTETNAEKEARLKQEKESLLQQTKINAITVDDMKQFNFPQFEIGELVHDNNMTVMLININSQNQIHVLSDIDALNHYISEARILTNLFPDVLLSSKNLDFTHTTYQIDGIAFTKYSTFFECNPYTKTGKLSKYPLILHYSSKSTKDSVTKEMFCGQLFYMQDGSIGKATIFITINEIKYRIDLKLVGSTLAIKKIEKYENCESFSLYKS